LSAAIASSLAQYHEVTDIFLREPDYEVIAYFSKLSEDPSSSPPVAITTWAEFKRKGGVIIVNILDETKNLEAVLERERRGINSAPGAAVVVRHHSSVTKSYVTLSYK
jgi:hypothetical protein